MFSASDLLVVGHLISEYGVKGWLKVRSYTEPPENLFKYQPWLLKTLHGLQPFSVDQWHAHSKGFVAKIAGVDSCQHAKSFCNFEINADKSHLSSLQSGQYYWYQLQGLRVVSLFNNDENCLGAVKYLIATGANDVLVVHGNKHSVDQRERLIPYVVDQYIKRVDVDSGIIYVEWDPEF